MTRARRQNRKRVYFIKPIGMRGPIKIGCSCSPERRRDALENWAPFPLEIVAEISGSFDLEQRFHAAFEASHERREWFAVTPELEATIAALNAGTFDIETLPPPKMLPKRVGRRSRVRTAEERLQLSYSGRIARLRRASGFRPTFCEQRLVKDGLTDEADKFLVAPHVHGVPMQGEWWESAQKRWLEGRADEEIAA